MPLTEEERNQHFDTITNSETIADRALAIEALRNDSIELNSNLTESESLLDMTPEEEEYIKNDIKIVAETLKIQYEEDIENITTT